MLPWRPPAFARHGELMYAVVTVGGATAPLQAAETEWTPCHRIISSEYAGENLFDRLGGAEDLEAFLELADLTNPGERAKAGAIDLVPLEDRVYGPGSGLIMAAFAWPTRDGRFSTARDGAYYAAALERTAVAETVYHREHRLLAARSPPVVMRMTLVHADLRGTLVDVRTGCPRPTGVDDATNYQVGQDLGALVRQLRGDGMRYNSVRDAGGECAAVFRPPVLSACHVERELEYHWDGAHIAQVR